MSGHRNKNNIGEVRVELKYCEHCGGLWVRERGAGVVYCEKCQAKVDDLPMGRRMKARKPKLPKAPQSVVEEYGPGLFDEELSDIDAVGGVA